MPQILTFLIPISVAIISYIVYTSKNTKSVYSGKGAWTIDILAMLGGLILILRYPNDIFLYFVGNMMGIMHLVKFSLKLFKKKEVALASPAGS